MKLNVLVLSLFCLGASALAAPEAHEMEAMKKQLRQLQETFEQVRREQQQQIEALTKKLEALSPPKGEAASASQASEDQKLAQQLAAELNQTSPTPAEEMKKPWRPENPIRVKRGAAFLDVGLVGTLAAGASTADDIAGGLQPGGHDPNQRGFTVQGLEANFNGAVDPYFRGNASLLFSVDAAGESFLELEEVWLETMSLPGNFQIRAGQYLTEFGRLNTQHPHGWSFVDSPLVNARLLGADGLRNPGARLSWLAPTQFFSEWFFGIQNSHGETAASFRSSGHSHGGEEAAEGLPFGFRHPDNERGVRPGDDLLLSTRYAASFDLTDNQALLLGVSAAFGPNSSGQSGDVDTQIYGMDFTWKWKSPRHDAGFPFVTWQTEAMLRRFRAGAFDWDEDGNGGNGNGDPFIDEGVLVDPATGLPAVLPAETLVDYGFYSQLTYGFKRGWVAGLRLDYLTGRRGDYEKRGLFLADGTGGDDTLAGRDSWRDSRWRISPNLTWHLTEFSKLRLQHNYDDRRDWGVDHSVWLQWEFLLDAHAAHKF